MCDANMTATAAIQELPCTPTPSHVRRLIPPLVKSSPLSHPHHPLHLARPAAVHTLSIPTRTLHAPQSILTCKYILPAQLRIPSTEDVVVHSARRAERARSKRIGFAHELQLHTAAERVGEAVCTAEEVVPE
jgi:hypothetical protein